MKTITLGRARYKVRDDRDIMGKLLKITGKHKPVKSKGAIVRMYPSEGATLSTAAYVKQYYGLNSERRLFKNLAAPFGDDNLAGFYEGLSDRLTVPVGEDSMELCHED